jgi:hypothetical protein
MPKYCAAEDVAEIAADMIANNDRFADLAPAKIEYLFLQTDKWTKDDEPFGIVCVLHGPSAFLSGRDIAIIMNASLWGRICEMDMASKYRRAAVSHVLNHIERGPEDKDGYPTWKRRGHDFAGFVSEIEDFGFWNKELSLIDKAAKQLKLFDDSGETMKCPHDGGELQATNSSNEWFRCAKCGEIYGKDALKQVGNSGEVA